MKGYTTMAEPRWEYKVAYVEGWRRISVEGAETYPEEHERQSAFGRRFLNMMSADGWELVNIQLTMPNCGYYIFRRVLAEGAEPDLSVVRREAATHAGEHASQEGAGAQAVSL
jgi:hypothetical protein